MRCLSLASELARHGYEVVFVSRSCSPALRRLIGARGHESLLIDLDEGHAGATQHADAVATAAVQQGRLRPASWVVVDHYGLDQEWEREFTCAGIPVLVIDDLANRSHVCDVLLDQNMIGEHHARYRSLVPGGARLLLGGYYALLRQEFAPACIRREQLVADDLAQDVVVFLGAVDSDRLTLPLARALSTQVRSGSLVVLVGHLNQSGAEVLRWCSDEGVRCVTGLDDLARVMETCRVFVGACGMTAIEAQALNIPCVLVGLSPIQRAVAGWLSSEGRAVQLGLAECRDSAAVSDAFRTALQIRLGKQEKSPFSVYGARHVADELIGNSNER